MIDLPVPIMMFLIKWYDEYVDHKNKIIICKNNYLLTPLEYLKYYIYGTFSLYVYQFWRTNYNFWVCVLSINALSLIKYYKTEIRIFGFRTFTNKYDDIIVHWSYYHNTHGAHFYFLFLFIVVRRYDLYQ